MQQTMELKTNQAILASKLPSLNEEHHKLWWQIVKIQKCSDNLKPT